MIKFFKNEETKSYIIRKNDAPEDSETRQIDAPKGFTEITQEEYSNEVSEIKSSRVKELADKYVKGQVKKDE